MHERKTENRLRSPVLISSYIFSHQSKKFSDNTFKVMFHNFPTSTPDKPDNSTAIVKTSTQSGNLNLNLVLTNLNNPRTTLSSSSSNSDIKIIPQEQLPHYDTASKKLNSIISCASKFLGLSYLFVNTDKWIYSNIPMVSKVVKKIKHPEVFSLKTVEANIEKDQSLRLSGNVLREKIPRAKEKITNLGQYYGQHYGDFAAKENCLWMDG